MDVNDIDTTDYAILQSLSEVNDPVWKKKLHVRINEQHERFPGVNSVSVQTVGRHVDKLHDLAYLESCIVSPENLNRDLIISYRLTDDGVTVLQKKRESLIKSHIIQTENADKAELLELIQQEIGLDEETMSFLSERDRSEVIATAEIYYMRKYLDENLDEETITTLRELMSDQDLFSTTSSIFQ